ncbi:MAG: HDIG domain-containing metalloprotein [Candidatus Omnitrophota bacterium]
MNKVFRYKAITEIATNKQNISIALILVFCAAALFSMFISPQLYQWNIHEGDIALKDVYAPYDFTYFWEIDDEKTQKAKEVAAKRVPYYLWDDTVLEDNTVSETGRFFDVLDAEKEQALPINDKVNNLKDAAEGKILDKNLKVLLEYHDSGELRTKTILVLQAAFKRGYLSSENYEFLKEKGVAKVSILSEEAAEPSEQNLNDLLVQANIPETLEALTETEFGSDRKIRQAVSSVLSVLIVPNLRLDEKKTESERIEAEKSIDPIYRRWEVKKNELIVEKGKWVNARHITQVSQLRRVFRPGITPSFFIGVIVLFFILWMIVSIFMSFTQKKHFLTYTKNIVIILLNLLFIIIVADFIMRSPQPTYFVPMAGMAMIITLLVNFNAAFICAVIMSLFISLLMGGGSEVMLVLLTGSVVGMFAVKGARRRTQILWAGLLAGLAKFAAIACIGLINSMQLDFFIHDGLWGIASGVLSGFIVMGLLPVFEHLFKVPTNISLLELSDLNHPLLKKLAMEAPGTYHHSIMVGNLAESACDAISANSLLARVGAYYHDIGKMSKAEYFTENEMTSGSKHSNLAPSMSALIIAKHVKEGEELAKKYKLNTKIIDFITQHHGDSLIFYFYQKAIQKAKEPESLKEDNFRYPGPKPQTKESAIVLLADSVEASSRALDDPTPSSIRNLVKKIINNKFIDGQLDNCDLTLKDMHEIANSFVRVLTGVFHTRLDYPEDIKKSSNGTVKNGTDKLHKPKQKKKD